MESWRPTTLEEVERILADEMEELHPAHRSRFESIRVTPRKVPVTSLPGEHVYVVAEYEGKVLYWSDVEEGWELEALNSSGGITERGCSQFELTYIMHQVFGDPDALT